jgi:hypothetical protein
MPRLALPIMIGILARGGSCYTAMGTPPIKRLLAAFPKIPAPLGTELSPRVRGEHKLRYRLRRRIAGHPRVWVRLGRV